jgi:hypothetical protein
MVLRLKFSRKFTGTRLHRFGLSRRRFLSLERVHFLFNSAVRLAFVETDDDGVSVLPQVSMLDHHCCASRAKLNTGAGCINPI